MSHLPVRGVAFTSDVDWAPDPVIEDMLALFEQWDIACTLFATHDSDIVRDVAGERFEVAVHPNFNPLLEGSDCTAASIVDALLECYPDSVGVRAHSLTQNSRLSQLYADRGLLYESNQLLPYQPNVAPHRLWNDLVRIPLNWQDDVHAMYKFSFDTWRVDVSTGLHVFSVHPAHVFLNTERPARWQQAKTDYHEPKRFARHRNRSGTPGTRDLLRKLLQHVHEHDIPTPTLSDIARRTPSL